MWFLYDFIWFLYDFIWQFLFCLLAKRKPGTPKVTTVPFNNDDGAPGKRAHTTKIGNGTKFKNFMKFKKIHSGNRGYQEVPENRKLPKKRYIREFGRTVVVIQMRTFVDI